MAFTTFEKAVVTTGTNIAYLVTAPSITAMTDMKMPVNFHVACGDNPTIQINGLGAIPLVNSR